MKQFLLILTLLLGFMSHAIADTNYLHVATINGWEVINLDNADKLTFKGGTMTVTDVKGTILGSYPQTSLTGMYVDQSAFSNILTAVKPINSESPQVPFTVSQNGRLITLENDGCFEIFTNDGKRILVIEHVTKGKTIDLSALTPGFYIYRLGQFAIKKVLD